MELSVPCRLQTCSSSQLLKPRVRVRVRVRDSQLPLISSNQNHKTLKMESQRTICCASIVQNNGSPITSTHTEFGRIGEVKRVTKETNVSVKLHLDGTGIADSSTGIPFLDHMLDQLASHGLFDVHVKATGDIHIDDQKSL